MMRIHSSMLIALGWSVCALSAAAQAPRPDLATPRRYTVPRLIESSLPNGFELTLVPYGTTPTARVELVIDAGIADEPAGQVGIAELVGDYLREGSRSRDADSLAKEVSGLGVVGGEIGVTVGPYQTVLRADVLAESTPALVQLLGDLVQNPAFAPTALARLEANQVRRLALRRGQAATIAAARGNALLFPNHPADRMATPEEVQALSHESVRRFHAAHFVATRAHLYVAGRFEAGAVEEAARNAFGAMVPGQAVIKPSAAADSIDSRRSGTRDRLTVHLLDRPGATQARIQLSVPVVDPSHPDYPILNQLNILLGSVQTARIIANVRERHGYSYNVSSRMIHRPGSSQWALTADVANDVTAAALREILTELARVVAEPPADDELRRFQTFLAGVLVSENATAAGILEKQRYFDLYGVDPAYRANFVERTHDVRANDIQRVARTYFQPGSMILVVVGDRRALAAQLASIGRVTD